MIGFRGVVEGDVDLVKGWWHAEHVAEFWDMSDWMWQNFVGFTKGQGEIFEYFIAEMDGIPFGLVITSDLRGVELYEPYVEGETSSIDFMIGEGDFLGKGWGAKTLRAFMEWRGPKRYLIDPAEGNGRAVHVYEKAGFERVGSYVPDKGFFKGKKHLMMRYDHA